MFRRIVSFPRFHRITRFARDDLYLPEPSVFCGIGGDIPQAVLAAQLLGDLIKDFLEPNLFVQHERGSTRFIRKFSERAQIPASTESAAAPSISEAAAD